MKPATLKTEPPPSTHLRKVVSEGFPWIHACVTLLAAWTAAGATPAAGPLRVHPSNPRYFTDGTKTSDGALKVVYLTGSHTWDNLQDMGAGDPPKPFDFDAYLDFLGRHHHNFIRLWRWEQTTWDLRASFPADTPNTSVLTVAPHPWARTGHGKALDGKPKFNLEQFDPVYFERLLSRVQAAKERGIYVSVMLFEGWVLLKMAWDTHPFNKANNANRIDGDPNADGKGYEAHSLLVPAISRLQEAYVRHVIDTVGHLDNVLFEIANESGQHRSTEWQYHMTRYLKNYEATKPKQHAVGMTFQWSPDSVTDTMLFESPADWVSPHNAPAGYNYKTDPPAADGRKVVLPDTDHLWGIGGTVDWAWKSFLRGHNPIFMDPYENRVLGKVPPAQWEALRQALGHTRRLADRVDLARLTPAKDIASTKYCLAHPGFEYVVYQPGKGKFTVDLTKAGGDFSVEWIDPATGKTTSSAAAKGGAVREFAGSVEGPAVLHLKAIH